MTFKWFSKNESDLIATIYDTNITLNKAASDHFETAYSVMLGYDPSSKIIGIKPLTKEAVTLGHIPEDQKIRISVWQSYARISNKMFISSIADDLNIVFKKSEAHKFRCEWDKTERLLRVYLNEEVGS